MSSLPPSFSKIPYKTLLYPSYNLQITPLTRLKNHLETTQPSPEIYICNEHTNSPLAFGGNKIRKLEYLVPDILASDPPVTTLVTTGGIQSNHQRAVAAVAAHLGLKCTLIPTEAVVRENQPDPKIYRESGNVQFTQLLGANILPTGIEQDDAMKQLRQDKEIPYWIPSGSSAHKLGGLGYARFAFELDEWEKKSGIHFSAIVVACASGSTLGGMIAGFKLLEAASRDRPPQKKRQPIGIDAWASREENSLRDKVLKIAKRTGILLGLKEDEITETDVVVDTRYNAGSYGKCDAQTLDAMRLMAQLEGIILDPVYTGKAAAGLLGALKAGQFKEGENVLFIHTGGQMALSAYHGIH